MHNWSVGTSGNHALMGRVSDLWRYPVKSMQGEQLESAQVSRTFGVSGDRGWAVRDEAIGEVRNAKRLHELTLCSARYIKEPTGIQIPPVEITLSDGVVVTSADDGVHAALSRDLGREVTLWPRVSSDNTEHYRRREELDWDEIRAMYGLAEDEPFPDLADVPAELLNELLEFVSPIGTYFDAFELHLMTTGSMDTLRRNHDESAVDVRRFRPNIVVDTGKGGADPDQLLDVMFSDAKSPELQFPEFAWIGRRLSVGELVTEVVAPVQRCVMITLPQGDLERDRSVLKTLVSETRQNLGVGLRVLEPAMIQVGDEVRLV